jgi:hypothetical protein
MEYALLKSIRRRKGIPEEYRTTEVLFQTDLGLGLRQWVFHDEHWNRVKNRWKDRAQVAAGLPLETTDNPQEPTDEVRFLRDGSIVFEGKAQTASEWLILYLDPRHYCWDDFSWCFPIRRDSDFRELQFAFRYRDFYNRYRFRFENDRIFFDTHIKGVFNNNFDSVPFHMKRGVVYHVRIDAYGNNFRCYIDGALMMNAFDFRNALPTGSIAMILWEDGGSMSIKASVERICVRGLERAGGVT